MQKTVNCVTANQSGFYQSNPKYEIPDDITDKVMSYEIDGLSEEATIQLFQSLIDTGLAQQFGGEYERTAKQLIALGACRDK